MDNQLTPPQTPEQVQPNPTSQLEVSQPQPQLEQPTPTPPQPEIIPPQPQAQPPSRRHSVLKTLLVIVILGLVIGLSLVAYMSHANKNTAKSSVTSTNNSSANASTSDPYSAADRARYFSEESSFRNKAVACQPTSTTYAWKNLSGESVTEQWQVLGGTKQACKISKFDKAADKSPTVCTIDVSQLDPTLQNNNFTINLFFQAYYDAITVTSSFKSGFTGLGATIEGHPVNYAPLCTGPEAQQ